MHFEIFHAHRIPNLYHGLVPIREERTTTLFFNDISGTVFFHDTNSDTSGSHRASLNDEFYFTGNDIVFLELPSRRGDS